MTWALLPWIKDAALQEHNVRRGLSNDEKFEEKQLRLEARKAERAAAKANKGHKNGQN